MNASGGERKRERVTLSVDARPREEAHSPRLEIWQEEEEGVLSLRVVDPGRLVVKTGDEVIAAGALGWGEDQRLRVDPLEDYPPEALPRVVNREPGREEVEVHVRAEAGAGEQLTLAAVESLRASARSATKPALAQLLRRSGAPSLADPLAFLKEAEWLVSHPELEAEAVATLARKACRDRVDLGWLRATALTLKDLNAMARNR